MIKPAGKISQPYRRHFFKEWREFRGLTQEDAAAQMAVIDRTNLSRLERGAAPYGQKVCWRLQRSSIGASHGTF